MIIPSIDLENGSAVQLVGGEAKALDAGDPAPILERFAVAGEVAVVDLDAARGIGTNADLVRRLVAVGPCRVGGGIRDAATAVRWLDAGAVKVVLGTAATPEVLRELPRHRAIAALDARDGEVVVEGWRKKTGRTVVERMEELREYVGGFLVTFVEREGRLRGTALDRVGPLVAAAAPARLTVAGGVSTPEEVAILDRMGADAQVGMALYTGGMDLADAIAAPLVSDRPDGLWPTVVTDESGKALGLAWSDRESLREAVRLRRGVYRSRSRGLWVKGETSGAVQELLRVALDCDRDAIRFAVRQRGAGFCHARTRTCWGADSGIAALARLIESRKESAPPDSYTRRLLSDPALLKAKLVEEAGELARAGAPREAAQEAADLVYFALAALSCAGGTFEDLERVLDRRALRLTRRGGEAKE